MTEKLICSEGKCILPTTEYSEGDFCPNQDTLLHEGRGVRLERKKIDQEFAQKLNDEIEKFDADYFKSADHREGEFPPQEVAYHILMEFGKKPLRDIQIGKAHYLLKIATESNMTEVAMDDHNQWEILVEEPWRICRYCGEVFDTHKGRRIHEGKKHGGTSLRELIEAAKDE